MTLYFFVLYFLYCIFWYGFSEDIVSVHVFEDRFVLYCLLLFVVHILKHFKILVFVYCFVLFLLFILFVKIIFLCTVLFFFLLL